MTLNNVITWIIFGLIVGVVANALDPSPRRMGILGSSVLGIFGAVLGGLVAGLFGFAGVTGFNMYSFLVALIGALIVLALGRSLYPAEGYGPEYYEEDLTNKNLDEVDRTMSPADEVEVKTTTRKVRRNDVDDL